MPIGTPKVTRRLLTAAALLTISACTPPAATPGATPRPDQTQVRPDHAITSGGANAIAAGGGNLVGQSGSNALPAAAPAAELAPASGAVPVIDPAALTVSTGASGPTGSAIAVGGGNVGVVVDPGTLVGQSGTNITAPAPDALTSGPGKTMGGSSGLDTEAVASAPTDATQ